MSQRSRTTKQSTTYKTLGEMTLEELHSCQQRVLDDLRQPLNAAVAEVLAGMLATVTAELARR